MSICANLKWTYSIPDFGVSTAIVNIIDIFHRRCKLNFGPLRGQVKSRHFPERINAWRQYFYFLYKFLGIVGRNRRGQHFWMMIRIYYYLLNGIRLDLDLDNSLVGYEKQVTLLRTTFTFCFFTHHTYSDLEKSNLLHLMVLLTAYQIIQVSFHTFLAASLLGYNKKNLIPVT